MSDKTNNLLKKLTVYFFLGFITFIPLMTLLSKDSRISEIENKPLTQKPKFTFDKFVSTEFMEDFNSYVEDQFPFRASFIGLKNTTNYIAGTREFRDIYITSHNRLMEKYTFNKEIIDSNLKKILDNANTIYDNFKIPTTLFLVPTSSGLYQEELPKWAKSDNQKIALSYIDRYISTNRVSSERLSFYSPFDILTKYKSYPIYFNTDHHWTQLGARIAYEDFRGENIDIEGLISNNYKLVSNSFFGTYYSKALLPHIKGDSIYAYKDFNNYHIEVDFSDKYNTLYNDSFLNGKNKYRYFLHGDPGYALIDGSGVGEILVFKDSYAHSFIPFLASQYKKVHVIDPRYYNMDLQTYLKENPNISKVLYLYNIQTFSKNTL